MLKQEIIEKITKYFKLTDYEAEKIYDDIIQNIIIGVKEDNISELFNLGEFILKPDDRFQSRYKNTVEFLLSANLEEEISNAVVSEPDIPPEVVEEKASETRIETESLPSEKSEIKDEGKTYETKYTPPIEQKIPEAVKEEIAGPVNEIREEGNIESTDSVEDEIKKKRDEIIHKLDPQHQEHYHPLLHVTEGIPLNVPKPVVLKEPHYEEEVKQEKVKEIIPELKGEVKEQKEEFPEPVAEEHAKEKEEVEDLSAKSFSDYFKEVKEEQKSSASVAAAPIAQVIPPAAVDLHKEIISGQITEEPVSIKDNQPPSIVKQDGNGYSPEAESKAIDNSYYIWYKDSEPNPVDTQTMSYEYELLYQATKEAEYKSKLRIYVTTFILFFSIVLLLLIFSPVIYKYFFTPAEEQETLETPPVTNAEDNKAPAVEPPPQQIEQKNTTQPVTSEQQNNQQDQTASNEQNTKSEQTSQQPNTEGLVKTEAGWKDEKIGVLYVQLENGKFAVQESAWNSEEKANQRISKVAAYNISGMSGKFVKVDLGAKGIWYRVRFGEFSTLDEAKQKAAELKSKGS